MKLYWWDEQGYGSWAFVLAESEEQAWELLLAYAIEYDKANLWGGYGKESYNAHYRENDVKKFRELGSLRVIEPKSVEWGEFS